MPAVVEAPLAVLFTLPGAVSYRRHMDDLPNQRLAADLAAALAAATHPHGPIRTRSVAAQYVQTARRMVRELHTAGFAGSLAELSAAVILEYWLGCDFHRERRIRAILAAYAATGGALDAGVARHLQGRRINQIIKSRPNPPYSDSEWRQLAAACTELITSSRQSHGQVLATIQAGTDPVEHSASADTLARLLHRTGPVTAATILDRLGPPVAGGADRGEVLAVRRALYPDGDTALAYLTLLAMRTGIVPDGIDVLTLSDITRTSPSTMLLSYSKGRTGREALNLPRDAVRLLERWLEHSALLRAHAGDRANHLWLYVPADDRGTSHGLIYTRPRTQDRRAAFTARTGLLDDDGRPLRLHGGRIRATYQHRRDRSAWTGRTTIDPNHSAQVEGDHYLHSHTPAQLEALDTIIEQAQTDLRRKAETPIVVSGQDAAEFAGNFPALVEQAGLDAEAVTALLTGQQDVFVAGCAAPLNSPHAPAGTLCPARPWVCLLCPLATFAPRHLPNLLRLKAFFARQGTQLTAAQFLALFGPYAARLDDDVLPRFAAEAIVAASRLAADDEAALPLHLEELAP
ncbi:MAG: hypothetical protein ABI603_07120 [Acidobacteriota bacterium]